MTTRRLLTVNLAVAVVLEVALGLARASRGDPGRFLSLLVVAVMFGWPAAHLALSAFRILRGYPES